MGHDRDNRDGAANTPGGEPPEKVDDRPQVGQVRPEDYPLADRATAEPQPDTTDVSGKTGNWDLPGQGGQVESDEPSVAGAKKTDVDRPQRG